MSVSGGELGCVQVWCDCVNMVCVSAVLVC